MRFAKRCICCAAYGLPDEHDWIVALPAHKGANGLPQIRTPITGRWGGIHVCRDHAAMALADFFGVVEWTA